MDFWVADADDAVVFCGGGSGPEGGGAGGGGFEVGEDGQEGGEVVACEGEFGEDEEVEVLEGGGFEEGVGAVDVEGDLA